MKFVLKENAHYFNFSVSSMLSVPSTIAQEVLGFQILDSG